MHHPTTVAHSAAGSFDSDTNIQAAVDEFTQGITTGSLRAPDETADADAIAKLNNVQIHCSINAGIIAKGAFTVCNAMMWQPAPNGTYAAEEFLKLVCETGYAFSNIFRDNHRIGSKFQCSNIFALDFDHEPNLAIVSDPWIRRNAFCGYTTPSDGKIPGERRIRIVLVAEGVYTTVDQYLNINRRLLQKFGQADQSCKDAARAFFGSPHATVWRFGHTLTEASITLLSSLAPRRRSKESGTDGAKAVTQAGNKTMIELLDSTDLVEHDGRNNHMMSLAGKLRQRVSLPVVNWILQKHNMDLTEPLEAEELANVMLSIAKYDGHGNQEQLTLDDFNERYAVVGVGSDVAILDVNKTIEEGKARYLRVGAFHVRMAPQKMLENKKIVPVSQVWIRWPSRKSYDEAVFDPNYKGTRNFNYFVPGGDVEPVEGDWSTIRRHIFEVLCSENQAHFDYMMGWLAHMVQKPGEKPGTCIVLRGGQGTGKSMFAARILSKLVGEKKFRHVVKQEQLTGKFNAILEGAILCFLDESYFPGSRRDQKSLDTLVTEERVNIEPKGVDPYKIQNFSRFIAATNDIWALNAGDGVRRYFCPVVSDKYQEDNGYFDVLFGSIQCELPGIMHFLTTYDLTSFNIRKIPESRVLIEQKAFSQDPYDQWESRAVEREAIFGRNNGSEYEVCRIPGQATTEAVWQSYVEFCQQIRAPHIQSQDAFGVRIRHSKKMVVERKRLRVNSERPYYYIFEQIEKQNEEEDELAGGGCAQLTTHRLSDGPWPHG